MRLAKLLSRASGGFTLVELAIVIVIAGILAAVAIPIYQGLINDSKWSEGKASAGSVRQAADVYKARQSGNFGGFTFDTMANTITTGQLKMTAAFDNLRFFTPAGIAIAGAQNAGTYTVTVQTVAGGPTDQPNGTAYTINEQGEETGP